MDDKKVLKIAEEILSSDDAFESDFVFLDIANGGSVTEREKILAKIVSDLYRLIHSYVSEECNHGDWIKEFENYE